MKRRLIALLTFSIALGTAATAAADEVENLPGSMCVASTGELSARSDGQAENATASSVTAVCPAPRPNIGGSVTTDFSAVVWVMDRHASQNVCCRVYSKNPGGALITGTQVCSAGESTAYQVLTLPGINDPYSWSHFFVQCTVPPVYNLARSRIETYRSTQQ